MHYVCKQRIFLFLRAISLGVLCIEREGHIEAVQPYLMRVYLLVPEFSRLSTGLGIDLLAYLSGYPAVALVLVAVHVVQIEIDSCRTDMVDIVIGFLVFVDLALFISHCVGPVTDILHDLGELIASGCV